MSCTVAETVAAQYPQYATQITAAAKSSFLAGDQYAYLAGIIAVLIGAALVFFVFPKRDKEPRGSDGVSPAGYGRDGRRGAGRISRRRRLRPVRR